MLTRQKIVIFKSAIVTATVVKQTSLEGIIVPLITPILPDLEVDESSPWAIVNHVITGGVDGILVNGATAEFYSLSRLQRKYNLIRVVGHTEGRVPVIANVTDNLRAGSYEEALQLTKQNINDATEARANHVLLCPYYYNSITEENVVQFTKEVADYAAKKGLPLFLYNNQRIHHDEKSLPIGVVSELSRYDNIAGIKDSSEDLDYFMQLLALQNQGFKVFQGSERLIHASFSGKIKPAGIVPSMANVAPEFVRSVYEHPIEASQRNMDWACALLYGKSDSKYTHIIGGIKDVLCKMGLISTPRMIDGSSVSISSINMRLFEQFKNVQLRAYSK